MIGNVHWDTGFRPNGHLGGLVLRLEFGSPAPPSQTIDALLKGGIRGSASLLEGPLSLALHVALETNPSVPPKHPCNQLLN